jgi:hypothetical protein
MVPGLIAGAGLTADAVQFKFVKMSADRTVVLCNANDDVPIGVLQAPVKAAGDAVSVMAVGISKVRMAAGVPVAGAIIHADVDGQAAFLGVSDSGYYSYFTAGQFIETLAATVDGVIGVALIDCMAPVRAK